MGCDLWIYSPQTFCIYTHKCLYIHDGGIRRLMQRNNYSVSFTNLYGAPFILTFTPAYFTNLVLAAETTSCLNFCCLMFSDQFSSTQAKRFTVNSSTSFHPSQLLMRRWRSYWQQYTTGEEDTACSSHRGAYEHFTPKEKSRWEGSGALSPSGLLCRIPPLWMLPLVTNTNIFAKYFYLSQFTPAKISHYIVVASGNLLSVSHSFWDSQLRHSLWWTWLLAKVWTCPSLHASLSLNTYLRTCVCT